jgi:hypothetical protein
VKAVRCFKALVSAFIVAGTASCAASVAPVTPTRAQPTSWVASNAPSQTLLYVSDEGASTVNLYAYPGGTAVGQLAGLAHPAGLCVDKAADVWIVESGIAKIVKYPHGGKHPIAARKVSGAFKLSGCAVEPNSGSLAVTSLGSPSGGGGVWLFAAGKGTPKAYTDPQLQSAYFCAFDSSGNLFIDGLDSGYTFVLFELPAGSGKLQQLGINQNVAFPGGVQWDGKYVALGDQAYHNAHKSAVYRLAISGTTATVKGTAILRNACDVLQFGLSGGTLLAPDACKGNVDFYHYPCGGFPTKKLTGLQYPVAAVVSI